MKICLPILFVLLIGLDSCRPKDTTVLASQTLELRALTVAADGSAELVGRIMAPEGAELGVVYANKPQPTVADTKISFGASKGITINLQRNVGEGLPLNTKIYFRLYVAQDGRVQYSSEGVYYNSPRWKRLPDLPHEANPMPEATLTIVLDGRPFVQPRQKYYNVTFRTKSLDGQEQTGRVWRYFIPDFANQGWTSSSKEDVGIARNSFSLATNIVDAGYNPSEILRGVGGGGYYYIPQLYPPFVYQKQFADNVGTRAEYPGIDALTLVGAVGKILPELYVLELGGNFDLWNFTRLRGPIPQWAKLAAFPYKSSGNLAMFSTKENLYVLVEDAMLLYQFSPANNSWKQMKKPPFAVRQKGVGFSFEETGYYGLGYNPLKGENYREIWRYNEPADSWEYAFDYPGTATVGVAVAGGYDLLFMGLGYQAVPTTIGTMKSYAASDVWQLKL